MDQHFAALDERVGLRGKVVLDYGCGVGNFLEVARRSGVEPVGLEYDDVARREAEAKGFRVAKTIDELDQGMFDFVYMNDVIEHLRDPVADLREIRLRLKPDGVLFVVTMNMRGLKPRMRGKKWDVVTNPTHLWFYDETSLTVTLHKSGYDKSEVQRWPVHFDHHGGARRLLQTVLQRRGLGCLAPDGRSARNTPDRMRLGISVEFVRNGLVGGTEQALHYLVDGIDSVAGRHDRMNWSSVGNDFPGGGVRQ